MRTVQLTLEAVLRDLHFAARLLARNKLFAATASLSLAIGIGATTTVFTVANGLLLRSAVGVGHPSQLVDVVVADGPEPGITPVSLRDYQEVARRTTTLQGVYAYELQVRAVSFRVDEGGAERVYAQLVTPNYFSLLQVGAAMGRALVPSDAEPVAVISNRFWHQRFDGSPAIVGRVVRINSAPVTVVGVAADGFAGTGVLAPDVWMPIQMVPVVQGAFGRRLLDDDIPWLLLGGRLKPDVTREQASAEVAAIGHSIGRGKPRRQAAVPGGGVERARGAIEWSVERASPIPYRLRVLAAGFLTLLGAIVGVVLAIACANVAGVLLARAVARRREISIRLAVGAARARLVRQLLTETVVLFALGGAAGLALARLLTTLIAKLLPSFPVPVTLSLPLDARVVLFSLLVSAAAAIAAGLLPAFAASRADVLTALKDDTQTSSERMRARNAFVIVQVALSMLLTITGARLVRALDHVTTVNRGFDARGVDTASFDLAMAGYSEPTGNALLSTLLDRVGRVPGVSSVAVADHAPGPGAMSRGFITVPGYAPPEGSSFIFMNWTAVTKGYFGTLRIPLVAGRDFTDADRRGAAHVAIVSESAARRFWPGRDAIGRTILSTPADDLDAPAEPLTIVGVARDLGFTERRNAARLDLYVPLEQYYSPTLTVLARNGDEGSRVGALRDVLSSLDRNLPVLAAESLEAQQNGPVETQLRIAAIVAGGVGLVGLLLASIGVYGVTAYTVARRTREIAIRLTLGAASPDVVRLVLRHGMGLVAIGSVGGVLLALPAGKALAASRFAASPAQPMIFAAAAVLFAIIGLIACYVPVRRATRINAMEALRSE